MHFHIFLLKVGVNPDLYYLVFGESLLNDGVAVVFYDMMLVFVKWERAGQPITLVQVGLWPMFILFILRLFLA